MEYYFEIMFEIKFEISSGASCPHLSHELKRVNQTVDPHKIVLYVKRTVSMYFFVVIHALKLTLTNPTNIVIIFFTNSRKQGLLSFFSREFSNLPMRTDTVKN